jgi:uncharacterized protein YggU (UPF0235/DUF167 family)
VKLYVKAHPKSRQEKVVRTDESRFEVWVREAPYKGRANEAVVESLARHLGVAKSRLSLFSGASSRNKVIVFSDRISG